MIIVAILIGIVIGLIRGGRISRLQYINLKCFYLFIIAFIIHAGIIIMNIGLFEYKTSYYSIMLTASYALVLIGLIVNVNLKYFIVLITGMLANLICFVANNFKFPINSNAVKLSFGNELYQPLMSNDIKFFIPWEQAKIKYLGKIIHVDVPFFNDLIVSAGDIVIAIGIILFIQATMSDKYIRDKGKLKFAKGLFK